MSRIRLGRSFRPRLMTLEDRVVLSANILYVDASIAAHSNETGHDGSSWSRAYPDLQDALDRAATTVGDDQIRIAAGTYTPSKIYAPLDNASTPVPGGASGLSVANLKTFSLPDGVTLYGGFAYGMQGLGRRDPAAYPTVLSGDLGRNDIKDPSASGYAASKADNAWHVVTAGDDVSHRRSRTRWIESLNIESNPSDHHQGTGGLDVGEVEVTPRRSRLHAELPCPVGYRPLGFA